MSDEAIIGQCLRAAAEREEIRRIADAWPEWDDEVQQADAVNNTLNNLLGYPHGRPAPVTLTSEDVVAIATTSSDVGAYTLKRNSTTSPSRITYSLPSMRTWP